jgi:hypothetical protein
MQGIEDNSGISTGKAINYLTGKFIAWDHLMDMSGYYMKSKGIEFDSTIDNFSVLQRVEGEKEYKFYPFIRAPRVFRNYIE